MSHELEELLMSISLTKNYISYHKCSISLREGNVEFIRQDRQRIRQYKTELANLIIELELMTQTRKEETPFFKMPIPNSEFVIVL